MGGDFKATEGSRKAIGGEQGTVRHFAAHYVSKGQHMARKTEGRKGQEVLESSCHGAIWSPWCLQLSRSALTCHVLYALSCL
ncbi:hypothetical protein AMJ87_09275 [candidate division WOR_3 bacterium SM23_60]|uniref:Uncharacterized protein n=1 Tax=candidate division WOR_3 bacterium SM23_60 TaxID=1703780 RepID=A0A0S8GEC3_UNCW3|nr:MAG: hypothetical protein AMJ87_09275 [candidate division WOR_3 bacterium SM23_60]